MAAVPVKPDATQAERAAVARQQLQLEDGDNPMHWKSSKKIRNNCILAYATFALTYASSAMAPSLTGVVEHYHVSREAALLNIALFVLGFGVGPFLLGPSSDVFGRRKVYIISYLFFTAFSWGVVFAPNYGALIVFRLLSGIAGASSLNNHPASIADFCPAHLRNRYTSLYAMTAFEGAALAPFFGGFIVARTDWRWNLIVTAIIVSTSWLLMVVGVDESCAPYLLAKIHGHHASGGGPSLARRLKTALQLPFKLLFTEPVLAFACLYISLLYGIFYGFFAVFPVIYEDARGWSPEGLALSYIALALGFAAGALILRYGQDWAYTKKARSMPEGKQPPPETRFAMMYLCSWTVPLGIFLIAFCSYRDTHWFGDVLGMFLFSLGTLVVFTGMIPFLIDIYLKQAASALAAGVATRAIFACSFPLFATQMYNKLGIPGASCLLGGIALLLTPMPWVFRYYGDKLWGHKNL